MDVVVVITPTLCPQDLILLRPRKARVAGLGVLGGPRKRQKNVVLATECSAATRAQLSRFPRICFIYLV